MPNNMVTITNMVAAVDMGVVDIMVGVLNIRCAPWKAEGRGA